MKKEKELDEQFGLRLVVRRREETEPEKEAKFSLVNWFPCSNCFKNCLISTKFGMQVHKDNTKAKFEGQCNSCRFTYIN